MRQALSRIFALSLLGLGLMIVAITAESRYAPIRDALPPPLAQDAWSKSRLHGSSALPAGLRQALRVAVERRSYDASLAARQDRTARRLLRNRAQGFAAELSAAGARVRPNARAADAWELHMRVTDCGGRGEPSSTNVTAAGNRVELLHGFQDGTQLTEWFVNSRCGLEHGFTVPKRPSHPQALRVEVALSGSLEPSIDAGGTALALARPGGGRVLTYDHLYVHDASGRALPARMELARQRLCLVVDDRDAKYPVTVDPLLTSASQLQKLTAGGATATEDLLGAAIAISDKTIVVGVPAHEGAFFGSGMALVFEDTSADGDWSSPQVTTLTAGTDPANLRARFGHAVAIAGDTILIGAPGYGADQDKEGRVFVFRRSGGVWPPLPTATLRMTAPVDDAGFGWAVGLTRDAAAAAVSSFTRVAASFEGALEIRTGDGTLDQWGMFEEIVATPNNPTGDDLLYDNGLGSVTRSSDLAFDGSHSLLLWANAAKAAPGTVFVDRPAPYDDGYQQRNNHVIAQRQVFAHGVQGRWRYEFHFQVPNAQDAEQIGQTGPEWSMQSTRDVSPGVFRTHTSGIQYIANPDDTNHDKWQIWTTADVNKASWQLAPLAELNDLPLAERRIDAGSWYYAALEVDYTNNKYIKLELRGPNIDRTFDLDHVAIEPEIKFEDPAFWISVEGQNQFTGFMNQTLTRHYKVYYDDIRLTKAGGATYVFEPGSWTGELTPGASLAPMTPVDFDFFGHSLGIDGERVVVGASGDDESAPDGGAAYVFDRPGGAWAGAVTPSQKLLASDGARSDELGHAVAIEGDTIVAGAPRDDQIFPSDPDSDSGTCYVFRFQDPTWNEQQKVFPNALGGGRRFGAAVALDQGRLVAGAPGDSQSKGSAYLFRETNSGWGESTILVAKDRAAGDRLGVSVAIDGHNIVAGAVFGDDPSASDAGAAYVFRTSTLFPETLLTAPDGILRDLFGGNVAIDGDTAAIGATHIDSSNNILNGAVYVFQRDGGTWVLRRKLAGMDSVDGDAFGVCAISGRTIVVGATWDDDACLPDIDPNCNSGSAYIFQDTSSAGDWSSYSEVKLHASDAASQDRFGFRVAIDGRTIVVNSRAAKAYVYRDTSELGDWSSRTESILTVAGLTTADSFSQSVGVSGDTVLVTAYRHMHSGLDLAGAAYVFARNGATWSAPVELTAGTDAAAGDRFGWSSAIDGDVIVIGAVRADHSDATDAGAAYVFERNGGTWPRTAKLTASDAEDTDFFGHHVAIDDGTIVVGAYRDDDACPELMACDSGATYVYRRPTSGWADATQDWKLTASDARGDELFGVSVGVTGNRVLSGSPYADQAGQNHGAAYVHELPFAPTESGSNVVVDPVDPVTGGTPASLTFTEITTSGTTTVSTSTAGPPLPQGFQLGEPATVYDIQTTATFTGAITICIDYSNVAYVDEATLALLHFENGEWVDVTTSFDMENDIICGSVTSLSPLAVVQLASPATLLAGVLADLQALITSSPPALAQVLGTVAATVERAAQALSQDSPAAAMGDIEPAIHDLDLLVKKRRLDAGVGNGLMDRLTAAARNLAVDAIADAVAENGQAGWIQFAGRELAKGDKHRAAQRYSQAAHHYAKALDAAFRAQR